MLYAVSVILRDFCAVNGQIAAALVRAARRVSAAVQAARRAAVRRSAVSDPVYYVYAADRTGEVCLTNTAAFRAVDRLRGRQRESAAVYDENGWCLYR